MNNITFNSKETYLAYRSTWKTEYKNLSAEIRTLRQAERYHQRKDFAHLALSDAEEQCGGHQTLRLGRVRVLSTEASRARHRHASGIEGSESGSSAPIPGAKVF
jgi:hypothetical protein